MKKRLLAILMAATLAMTFVACGGEEVVTDGETQVETQAGVETEVVAETEAVAIDEEAKAAMMELFSSALAGADEAENTYWFLFDDELTVGAFVILSADYTQSINVVGTISEDETGALVITDEEAGEYVSFSVVEEGEDYLVVAVEEGNEVTLIPYDFEEAVDTILAIDETTEILN